MPVSSVQSGYSILQQSQKMADEAAYDIQQQHRPQEDFSKDSGLKFNDAENVKIKRLNDDDIDALLKLNQSSQYNRVGANVIQREQDMIGSLLDLHI